MARIVGILLGRNGADKAQSFSSKEFKSLDDTRTCH